MDGRTDAVREALERLRGFTHHSADNQDAEDIKTVCAALTSIDPDAIRAEARAELAQKIVDWPEPGRFSSPHEGEAETYWEIVEHCEAIISTDLARDDGEPKVGDIVYHEDRIRAWDYADEEMKDKYINKAIVLMRAAEVERKLKEAER